MEEGFLYWPLAITQHVHPSTHVHYTLHTKLRVYSSGLSHEKLARGGGKALGFPV